MSEIVIETSQLVKKYENQTVVDNLDMAVYEGEIFGFLGPNGAGKTTTMKMLLGLVHPTSGTGTVAGHDIVREVLDVRKSCGVLPDPAGFYDNLTARQNLRFYGKLYGLRGKDLESKADTTLDLVGLQDAKDKKIGKFSKGMKQRFGVAQAVVHDPPVLMFDEPTAGIDPQGAEDFRVLMRHLRDQGKTIFLTSHIMPEVEAICGRIGIIVGGRMDICGNVNELVDHYAQRQGYRLKLCTRHGDEITLFRLLKSIEGVITVTKNDDAFIIDSSEEISENVSRAVSRSLGIVVELQSYRPSLNELFLEVTRPVASDE
jgi:ABC-2 type transport system ATP-binding protein